MHGAGGRGLGCRFVCISWPRVVRGRRSGVVGDGDHTDFERGRMTIGHLALWITPWLVLPASSS